MATTDRKFTDQSDAELVIIALREQGTELDAEVADWLEDLFDLRPM